MTDNGTDRRPEALLLPALSSVSTRAEMAPLAEALSGGWRCRAIDWPGFGDAPRDGSPPDPASLQAFADREVDDLPDGALVVAAGHAAVYAVRAVRNAPRRVSAVALVAPTWRGPLPTMQKRSGTAAQRNVRRALTMPVVGPLLYALNVSDFVIGRMLRAHVYAAPDFITAERIAAKGRVARQPGARVSTAAFVSGALDPVAHRAAFLETFDAALPPILVLRPEGAPLGSAAEMDALAETGRVRSVRVPGALLAHEEHAAAVAEAISAFVASIGSGR